MAEPKIPPFAASNDGICPETAKLGCTGREGDGEFILGDVDGGAIEAGGRLPPEKFPTYAGGGRARGVNVGLTVKN